MLGGYTCKLLRVNLSKGSFTVEKINEKIAYNFLGGRGYAAKLIYDELKPGIDPLTPANKLIFMTGPLTATAFPGAGRTAVCSKSPLTGTVADSQMGGSFGAYLKRAGFDGIIFEGRSSKPVYLLLDGGRVSIKDASSLWGMSTSDARRELVEKHEGSWAATIGPAGENLAHIACIISGARTGREGVAGRCGLGAVMGSKRLKAVVVRGDGEIKIAHEAEYRKILEKIRQTIDTHPITGTDGSLARFGTALLVHRITAAGMLPRDNFSGGPLSFEDVDVYSGETVKERYLLRRTACFACTTACGRWIKVGDWEGKGPEYESIAMLGPNSGFHDYEREILPLSKLCDEFGLDTISVGNILGFARAVGDVKDFKDAERLVQEIASGRSEFSKGLAAVARKASRKALAAHVKGLELPAYDPRGAKGIALAYATSNRGGCHLRAYTIAPEILSNPEFVDPGASAGKAGLVRRMQDAFAVYDSLIACKFHGFALFGTLDYELDDIGRLLTAVTGLEWTGQHLREVGSRIYTVERMFNVREGFSSLQDSLPRQFGVNLNPMLREYYKERGWSRKGIPTAPPPSRKPKRVKRVEIVASPLERIEFPQLQVALDMDADVQTIAAMAKKVYTGGAKIIEAGTPSVKRHGVDSLLPALRKVAPKALLVADLKTMDVGNLEARIAFRAGADISAVLALGGRTKILEAVSEAARWNRAVLIDLIDCPDPLEMLEGLTRDLKGHESRVVFCLHRGISEQLKGRGIYEQTQLISEAKARAGRFPLAVAGGIKEGVAKDVAGAGADICIAGSAIYNSANPKETAKRILREIKRAYKR
ncbi:MAG: aldehyde ferredoxin oxidoreductase C-terminal domain-containing protein [Candidatus Hodarchaeaceae archaeon]|nr:aldehyde ferredoxin oxidoreductase C-terminal domain-containing protein [Candidatus Hodarchaeaceae archaeon]